MSYEIIRSKRRSLCLQVKRDGTVVVRAPLRASEKVINDFVTKHIDWIISKKQIYKDGLCLTLSAKRFFRCSKTECWGISSHPTMKQMKNIKAR